MMSTNQVLATQPTLESSLPTCITHPITGQLMAPGSKVWPYFIDHKKFGRCWIGPKATYLDKSSNPESVLTAPNMGKKKSAKKVTNIPKAEEPTSLQTQTISMRPKSTRDATPATTKPTAATLTLPRPSRKKNIDTRYEELMVRRTDLRLSEKIEGSNLIQAGVNVSVMWGWNKQTTLDIVERMEQIAANGRNGKLNPKMMEIAAEIERLFFNDGLTELRVVREHFKGESYDGLGSGAESKGRKLRAPGFLMLLQASLSVAFVKGMDNAEEDDEEFHMGVYDRRAVLYFKVPNKDCVEERNYLSQMSKFGTKLGQDKKITACPGIERPIKEEEKKMVLEKVRDEVKGGEKVIYLATALFGRFDKAMESVEEEGSVTEAAMKSLGDDGFLVLEHVYRKKFGLPILVGDEMVGEEGEEEKEDEREEEEEVEKTSLVVVLKYRRE